MKTTASNGTVLEVGKKYRIDGLIGIKFIEILDIGINEVWTANSNEGKYSYSIDKIFIPYKEPQPKPFEGYQKWYIHNTADNTINCIFAENNPVTVNNVVTAYTEQEAKELGLKI